MKKTILFDLDGTLLPMNQEAFIQSYFTRLAKKMAFKMDPDVLTKTIWKGTAAMVMNDGTITNEERFWQVFDQSTGIDHRELEADFFDFYKNEFNLAVDACCPNELAQQCVAALKNKGYSLVLATNPIFPRVATENRIRWAGLNQDDFALITTFETSSYCKPNVKYYEEIMERLNVQPQDCIMIGNDVKEDMVARSLGIEGWLITDCLLNEEALVEEPEFKGTLQELLEKIQAESNNI